MILTEADRNLVTLAEELEQRGDFATANRVLHVVADPIVDAAARRLAQRPPLRPSTNGSQPQTDNTT